MNALSDYLTKSGREESGGLLGAYDLIVDRCGNRTVHNHDHSNSLSGTNSVFEDLDDVIYYLMDSFEDRMDWDYLMKQAKNQSDECYKVAVHFKKYFKNLRGSVDPRHPKRKQVFQSDEYKAYLREIMNYHGEGKTSKDIFMTLASRLISPDDLVWNEWKDNVVFEVLLRNIRDAYKCQNIMFYSPSCFKLDNYRKATYVRSFIKTYHWEKQIQELLQKGGGGK